MRMCVRIEKKATRDCDPFRLLRNGPFLRNSMEGGAHGKMRRPDWCPDPYCEPECQFMECPACWEDYERFLSGDPGEEEYFPERTEPDLRFQE